MRSNGPGAGGGPSVIECLTYRIEAHTNSDDPTRYRSADDVALWKRRDPIERLEKYLVSQRLLSESDRQEIAAEAEALAARTRDAMNAPVDVDPLELFDHLYAEPRPGLLEQRALLEAELDAERSGRVMSAPASATSTVTMTTALNAALRDALAEDPTVVIFGEDVGPLGGVFRVTDGLHAQFGEDRIWDSPLAESGIVGTAIGMAMYGMRPVVEMQFDAFSYPAFEQIVSHLAKMRNRTRGRVSLPIVIRIPCAGGIGGVEHHSDSSEAYWAHTPGLTVVTPSNPADAYSMLREAIACDDPVIFMEPKSRYWAKQDVSLPVRTAPMTKAQVVAEGTDVTLIAYGPTVKTALETADLGADEGLSIEVVDLRSLSPFDDDDGRRLGAEDRRARRSSTRRRSSAATAQRSPRG